MSIHVNLNSETVDQCHLAQPLCLPPTTSVSEAVRQMTAANHGAVLVCRDERVVGVFTERDTLRMMAAGESFEAPLERFMTAKPFVLHAGDTVGKAISMMSSGGFRRLPIVDDDGRPTGLLKVEAILHYLAEHFPATIYNLPPEPHQTTQEREGA